MDTTAKPHNPVRTALRIAVIAALIVCGIVLFVAAGIAGGLLALNWFA
jgi:cell division septal protein FtsQ